MKAINLVLICLLPLVLWQSASAKDLKMGVIDIARILEESPQAEQARETLQKEFAPREQRLIETQKKIRSMEEQLARDGAIMSESERSKLERNILSKKRDFKRNQDEFRDDLNFKRNEILEKLDRKSTRLNSSHRCISYAVFCLKKKKKTTKTKKKKRKNKK